MLSFNTRLITGMARHAPTPKLLKYIICLILLTCINIPAFSWSFLEHKVIAEIAYQHLTPSARNRIDQLTKILDHKYPPRTRLYYAAIWPDLLIAKYDVTAFNRWHFIDYPYSLDKTPTKPFYPANNVAWAINQMKHILSSPKATKRQKAFALRYLIHLVGDAHQPLHCMNTYSKQYPEGDRGGNLFLINSPIATSLHQLWDQALGLFGSYQTKKHIKTKTIKKLANEIEKQYPPEYFGNKINDLDPWHWSHESHKLAINVAYKNIKPGQNPSTDYLKQGQQVAAKQLALAGYRLAKILN